MKNEKTYLKELYNSLNLINTSIASLAGLKSNYKEDTLLSVKDCISILDIKTKGYMDIYKIDEKDPFVKNHIKVIFNNEKLLQISEIKNRIENYYKAIIDKNKKMSHETFLNKLENMYNYLEENNQDELLYYLDEDNDLFINEIINLVKYFVKNLKDEDFKLKKIFNTFEKEKEFISIFVEFDNQFNKNIYMDSRGFFNKNTLKNEQEYRPDLYEFEWIDLTWKEREKYFKIEDDKINNSENYIKEFIRTNTLFNSFFNTDLEKEILFNVNKDIKEILLKEQEEIEKERKRKKEYQKKFNEIFDDIMIL